MIKLVVGHPVVGFIPALKYGAFSSNFRKTTNGSESVELSLAMYIGFLQTYPLILSVAGLIAVLWYSDVLGLVGLALELGGVAMLLSGDAVGFGIALFGAFLIVVGRYVRPLRWWILAKLDSGSGPGGRGKPPELVGGRGR